jgi:hypothetical protein
MTHPPNSYCRVTFYVASVQSLELAKPQRLNTGEIEATWTDNRHRRPHQLDRRPGLGHINWTAVQAAAWQKSRLADPKPVTQGIHLDRCNHSMGGGAMINTGHTI